jgi:hypothetical protein
VGNCGENNYTINLYECSGGVYTLIDEIQKGTTCYSTVRGLQNCSNANYMCTITDSMSGKPDWPVFVEWYWSQRALNLDQTHDFHYSGKMTFVATREWLSYIFDNLGGWQPVRYPLGIPLLNTTNHTPNP